MKKLFSFGELKKITKISLAVIVITATSLILFSFSGGGYGPVVPVQEADVIITLDGFTNGSWEFESQHQALANRINGLNRPFSPQFLGPTSKPSIEKIVLNPYFLNNRYYATGAAFPTSICIDGTTPSLSAINGADVNKQSVKFNSVRVDLSGKIWFQVMSQCENGKGLWWKFEKQYFPGDYPFVINDTKGKAILTFQSVTTNCLNNGKIYGCGSFDNK